MPFVITTTAPRRRKKKNLPSGMHFGVTKAGQGFRLSKPGQHAPKSKYRTGRKGQSAWRKGKGPGPGPRGGLIYVFKNRAPSKKSKARVTQIKKFRGVGAKKKKANPPTRRRRARRAAPRAYRLNSKRRSSRSRRNMYRLNSKRRSSRSRRNPGGIVRNALSNIRSAFAIQNWTDGVGGVAGLSASLFIPKLAGTYIHPMLGRGYGGVATSAVGTVLTSALVSSYAPRLGRNMLLGGFMGTVMMLGYAVSCEWMKKVLPFEEQMLACSLPTAPPAAAPMEAVLAAIAERAGVQGLGNKSMAQIIAGETSYRQGMKDYVNEKPVLTGRRGANDWTRWAGPAHNKPSYAGAESF